MNKTMFAAVTVALFAATFVVTPVASADAVVCAAVVCSQVSTSSETQVWTCGGSGNVIFIVGDENEVNVCSGGNNNTDDNGGPNHN